MLLGYDYQRPPDPKIAAKTKRTTEDDQPHQSPMRANGEVIRRNPSNDQLKKRRELARGRKGSLNLWGQNNFVTAGSMDPIAYTYEADYHCPECTEKRFGRGSDGYIAGETDGHFPEDDEGNEVHAVFPTDEWWEPSEPGRQVLTCGTCGREIDEIDNDEGADSWEASLKTAVDLGRELVGEKVMVTFTYENQGSQQMTRRMMLRDPEPGWSGEPGKYRFTDLDAGTEVFLAPEDIINITPAEGTTSTRKTAGMYSGDEDYGDDITSGADEDESFSDEPDEEDYIISDSRDGGSDVGIVGGSFFGNFPDRDAAEQAIAEKMRKEQFFPNVWWQSDHGNNHLIESFYDEHRDVLGSKKSARAWTCSECGHKNQGGSTCAECGFHQMEDERDTHDGAKQAGPWWDNSRNNHAWADEQQKHQDEYYKNNPVQEPGEDGLPTEKKQANDEAESNLEDGHALPEVEPGSKNDKPMWPWELTDKNPDSGVSETKTAGDYQEHHDYDNDSFVPPTCHRCNGTGHVPINIADPDDPYYDGPEWGDRECPDCGGSGKERDPEEVAEQRYFYGPSWND